MFKEAIKMEYWFVFWIYPDKIEFNVLKKVCTKTKNIKLLPISSECWTNHYYKMSLAKKKLTGLSLEQETPCPCDVCCPPDHFIRSARKFIHAKNKITWKENNNFFTHGVHRLPWDFHFHFPDISRKTAAKQYRYITRELPFQWQLPNSNFLILRSFCLSKIIVCTM